MKQFLLSWVYGWLNGCQDLQTPLPDRPTKLVDSKVAAVALMINKFNTLQGPHKTQQRDQNLVSQLRL